MLKILKVTPVTFHGAECLDLLIEDDSLLQRDCCDFCVYHSWEPDHDLFATCVDVHSCGLGPTYYQILPINPCGHDKR